MARKKLGKYEIIDRIGRGGMAEVYRGYHVSLDRYVAIKLLHPFLADDPEFKDRFENEARNVAKLKHPNIVQVYDFEYDAEGDSYYMVMELINGPTLKDRLFDLSASGERFSTVESIRIVKSAADALAYAHKRNMIHRDVKPANLMLDEDKRIVLTDFGIAKIVTGAQFTASGGMVGTPAYMAPEQGLGEAGDERSDLYSLGVILFQMITGHLPYDADTPLAVILKHVNDPIPSPRDFVSATPEDLERIIRKALAKDPDNRYQTADELVLDLSQLDETGRRHPIYNTPGYVPPALVDRDTRPAPPTPEQRKMLAAAAREAPVMAPPSRVPESPIEATPIVRPTIPEIPPGAPGRLRPAGVLGLVFGMVAVVILALAVFGGDKGPFAGLLSSADTTRTPPITLTAVAAASTPTPGGELTDFPARAATNTVTPAATSVSPTPRPTDTPTITSSPTPSPTFTPTPTDTPTITPSPTPSPTFTPTPTDTPSPTPNLTGTAQANWFATQAAASPTPNMTQTLIACDFEYIVVQPSRYPAPPSPTDFSSTRLAQIGKDFEFEIVLRNVGTCDWPPNVRLSYNAELTANPDASVNLEPVRAACADTLRPGQNFAIQQQPNFFFRQGVGVTEESESLVFTGTAPGLFGCYYGVWDLFYPNSDLTLGRPLVLAIRVWGG